MKILTAFWPAPLLAGLLMYASFPPLDLGWLMPVAWAILFLSMRLRGGRRAGWQVFVAAAVLFGPGVWWLVPLAWPIWLIVLLWCTGWEGLFGRFAGRLLRREGGPPAAWIVLLPAAHLAFDMLRTVVLSGFPWMLPGYAGWRNPVLLGSADLIGVHGATLATLVLAAGLAEAAARCLRGEAYRASALAPAAALWTALAGWALAKPAIEERPGPWVLLLQPSIPQEWKEDLVQSGREAPTAVTFWRRHEDLAKQGLEKAVADGHGIDLVVWGETMVPATARRPFTLGEPLLTFTQNPDGRGSSWMPADGRRIAEASSGAETLAGIPSVDVTPGRAELYFNTVVLLDDRGRVRGHQDKQHLTPGGEYIPLRGLIPFRETFEEYLRSAVGFVPDLQPGEAGHVVGLQSGAKAGIMVCYESAYPEVPRGMVRSGATVLFNCSNYGWFSHTAEMQQAVAICAFRAAELRRSIVLASNNGISVVLGPDGTQRGQATEPDVETFLVARAPLADSVSPFTRIGEWGASVLGAAATFASLLMARRTVPAVPSRAS